MKCRRRRPRRTCGRCGLSLESAAKNKKKRSRRERLVHTPPSPLFRPRQALATRLSSCTNPRHGLVPVAKRKTSNLQQGLQLRSRGRHWPLYHLHRPSTGGSQRRNAAWYWTDASPPISLGLCATVSQAIGGHPSPLVSLPRSVGRGVWWLRYRRAYADEGSRSHLLTLHVGMHC